MSATLQLVGLVLEIVGIVLMANGHTRAIYGRGRWWILVTALWRSGIAEEATRQLSLTVEDVRSVLQGLAFIGLGFLVQALSAVLSL